MNARIALATGLMLLTQATCANMPDALLARYQQDLDILANELPKRHANLFHSTERQVFEQTVQELRAQLPELDEAEALIGLVRISTLARDGHTALFLLPFPGAPALSGLKQLPIQFYVFDDGVRVIAVDRAHAHLLGAKLVGIGDLTVEHLRARIVPLLPQDNDMGRAEYLAWYLALPAVLHAIDASTDAEHAEFRFEQRGRDLKVDLSAMTVPPDVGWATQLMTLPGARDAWVGAGDAKPTPRWLKQTARPYWFEQDANGLSYAQINLLRDAGGQSFAAFSEQLVRQVGSDESARLVLDLRFNRGGDGDLIWPMIYAIIRHPTLNQRGRLFVITGRRTFSAAQMFANALEQHTQAVFVGEPTGSSPNHYGEVGQIKLPGLGVSAIYSQYYYQRHPADRRPWIPPHIAAPLRYSDLTEGRDPAMTAIANFAPQPNTIDILKPRLAAGDRAGARIAFMTATEQWRNPWRNLFEVELNDFGYQLLGEKRVDDAIFVFELVTSLYPDAANAWDSLGEAHALAGNRARAAYCYARSIKLNPNNTHGAAQLDALLGD